MSHGEEGDGGHGPTTAHGPPAHGAPAPAGALITPQSASQQQGAASGAAGAAAHQPAAGAAPAPGPAAPGQPPVLAQHCWSTAFDYNSRRWYFYNTATGQRQWDPPPGWAPPPTARLPPPMLHPAQALAAAAAAHAAAAHHLALASQQPGAAPAAGPQPHSPAAGGGGSSSTEQPSTSGGSGATGEAAHPAARAADPAAAAAAASALIFGEPGYYYQDAQGSMQGPFTKEQLSGWRCALPMDLPLKYRDAKQPGVASLELAKVLGDGELLARWQEDNPDKAAFPNSAPPAEAFEKELSAASYSDYAAAALAGLPASDDAVQVARIAAFSGKTIQDVLSFNYGAGGIGDYTMTALHCGARGRIQAAGAQREGLYDEMGSWVDASTVEAQLARAAEARRKGPGPKELQVLKARKQEMKKRKTMDWLLR